MCLRDYLNAQRVFRTLAEEWNCPVWFVKRTIRGIIHQSWEQAQSNPVEKALWDAYFPTGKPTPNQYIIWLGHAHETGENVPFLLNGRR